MLFITALFISVLDFKVRDRFEGALWTIPAKVYSRSLDISEGSYQNKDRLIKELELLGYKNSKLEKPGTYHSKPSGLNIFLRGFTNSLKKQDRGNFFINFTNAGLVNSIKRSDGISIDYISIEPSPIGGMYPSHMEDRIPLIREEVPSDLINILIAVEDKNFYSHIGFSIKSILRALFKNIIASDVVEGGSTITQQLAKSLFFTPEQTISRKLLELMAAILIEFHYSKDQIILAYINDVHLAQIGNRSINGFGLASEHFFGTSLKLLEVDQLSLLVGMLKGPSIFNPRRYSERALERRNIVLSILEKNNIFSSKEIATYIAKPISVITPRYGSKTKYPAFHDLVKLELRKQFTDKELRLNGLKIHTNLDPVIQDISEQKLQLTISKLQSKYRGQLENLESSIVIVDTDNGEIVSLVGSASANNFGFNRALNASRSIGSLIKPVVYLSALADYETYQLNTFLDDSRFTLDLPEGGTWAPNNFDKSFHGKVQLHEALWQSYNIATARLGMEIGVSKVLQSLKKLGYEKELIPLPSYLIGALEMTPLEVTQMYQTIASEGFFSKLRAVSHVSDPSKESVWVNLFQLKQRFRSEDIHLLKFALNQSFNEGTARGYGTNKLRQWNPGGKTGTSNDQRDSWFAGYAGEYLIVIWLGFDNNKPMPLTGRSGAFQVWKGIMNEIDPVAERIAIPKRINYLWVDKQNGKLSSKKCRDSINMPFIKGFEPKEYSPSSQNCRDIEGTYREEVIKKVKKIVEGIRDE